MRNIKSTYKAITKNAGGFTLIEVLIAVMLVGLAIASLVGANGAFTQANGAGTVLSTAEFLSEQIRELTTLVPFVDPNGVTTFGPDSGETVSQFDDLGDFDNAVFSPPIDAQRNPLSDFSQYSQRVTVVNVNSSNFEQVASDNSTSFIRVTVKVFRDTEEICSTSWLRAKY
jgi:MSHA pilin protein MshD